MTLSAVVEQRYRLQPQDLGGQSVTVTVSNVSLQGLERLQPVLHFQHIDKRMVLDDVQSDAMALITGQAILESWIGSRVTLTPAFEDQAETIAISRASGESDEAVSLPGDEEGRTGVSWRQPLLLVLLLILAFAGVFFIESGSASLTRMMTDIRELLTP